MTGPKAMGIFKGHVYDLAEKHKEREKREKEFYERTGFDVNRMSDSDKYIYGKAVERGFIKK